VSDIHTTAMQYLDKAVAAVRRLGFPVQPEANAPVLSLVEQLANVDQTKTLVIARTLQQASFFNALVRDHISGLSLAERYEKITQDFDSIREDAKRMVKQAETGKSGFRGRLQNSLMSVTRGSIPARFQSIKDIYFDVARDSKLQIDRESAILEAYKDFRGALKESEIAAEELLQAQAQRLERAQAVVEAAQQAVTAHPADDKAAHARLELARDQALRAAQDEDARYQIAKDLADNLKISYHTSEVVMGRLMQTTEVKKRVYNQAVTFFSTNETVFTALSAATTSQSGLAESTRTLNAMKSGINKGLEDLAEIGHTVLDEGIKAGYGPTLEAQSVQKLVESVIEFQEASIARIAEMRKLATENAAQIGAIVEEGKQRFVALATHPATALPPRPQTALPQA
jgi:hypothetical protein